MPTKEEFDRETERLKAEHDARLKRINRATAIAELAKTAPVTMSDAMAVFGAHCEIVEDNHRSSVMAIWAMLCREWATAMVDEIDEMEKEAREG